MTTNKSNSGDRVVRTLRVYESGRVSPVPGRPPANWGMVLARAAAHALPNEDKPTPTTAPAPDVKVKNPAKVAAGKARAAQAKARKEAEAKAAAAKKAKPKAKAPAKAPAKAKGGARPGSGPKPSGKAMVVVAFRVTPEQKRKLQKLGNGDFMRDRIDRATVPTK